MRLFCFLGFHNWHPTARVTDKRRHSKAICTRCGTRKWWSAVG
jgi:hypothetical protein